MADYYPKRDVWLRPLTINSANNTLTVVEDPNGTSDENEITVRESLSSAVGGTYYATASSDPVDGDSNSGVPSSVPSRQILNATNRTLNVVHLYEEIADQLTANSPNSLTYRLQAATPSGSSYTNSGIALTTAGGSTELQIIWNTDSTATFSTQNTIPPQLLGFDRDRPANGTQANSLIGTSIVGPASRGAGMWFSPAPANGKEGGDDYRGFDADPTKLPSRKWRFTSRERDRMIRYVQVAAQHVHAFDRADKLDQQDQSGLPADDNNNAIEDLWDAMGFADRRLIVAHHRGPASGQCKLNAGMESSHELTVAKLMGSWDGTFRPHEQSQTDPTQYAFEQYDLSIKLGEAGPGDFNQTNVTPYRH